MLSVAYCALRCVCFCVLCVVYCVLAFFSLILLFDCLRCYCGVDISLVVSSLSACFFVVC